MEGTQGDVQIHEVPNDSGGDTPLDKLYNDMKRRCEDLDLERKHEEYKLRKKQRRANNKEIEYQKRRERKNLKQITTVAMTESLFDQCFHWRRVAIANNNKATTSRVNLSLTQYILDTKTPSGGTPVSPEKEDMPTALKKSGELDPLELPDMENGVEEEILSWFNQDFFL